MNKELLSELCHIDKPLNDALFDEGKNQGSSARDFFNKMTAPSGGVRRGEAIVIGGGVSSVLPRGMLNTRLAIDGSPWVSGSGDESRDKIGRTGSGADFIGMDDIVGDIGIVDSMSEIASRDSSASLDRTSSSRKRRNSTLTTMAAVAAMSVMGGSMVGGISGYSREPIRGGATGKSAIAKSTARAKRKAAKTAKRKNRK